MTQKLHVGIIGCGGRGRAHALGYSQSERVKIVACADTYPPAAECLAADFDVPAVYHDYRAMLENEALDVVSVALWPADHAPAVLACVHAHHPPRLINAEKPMAPTLGEARRMHDACEQAGIMLTFSHQRRFGPVFHTVRERIRAGAVGRLVRLEGYCPNLFDWGTHWFDMLLFYNDDHPVDWVMGQVDCAEEQLVFGVRMETAGLSYFKWANGVTGFLATGANPGGGCRIRGIGTEGVIEVTPKGAVRVLGHGRSQWEYPPLPQWNHPGGDTTRYLLDSIDCLLEGRESILSSRNALRATESIFAPSDSARRRQQVLLPLEIEESPLLEMLDNGEIAIPDWPAFLTEEEEAEGWRLLFNGRDLSGWEPCAGPADAWKVRHGMLSAHGGAPAVLCTAEDVTDCTLALSWRLRASRGAAGIRLRVPHPRRKHGTAPLEIRLMDDRGCPLGPNSCGAVNGVLVPEQAAPLGAPGRWVDTEIQCRGTKLRVTVNGVRIVDRDWAQVGGIGPGVVAGRIALVSTGTPVDFRDIRILAPPGGTHYPGPRR